jgi:hypothetical protein
VVTATENLVGNFVTDSNIGNDDLLTFGHHLSTHGACIMGSARATPAKSFNLQSAYSIGEFD